MKINIRKLGLEEITFSDLIGSYDEDEINEIKEEFLAESYFQDDWMSLFKEKDSEIIECNLLTGDFDIINYINDMKICQDDPFVMIVKDAWEGYNSEGDEIGYVSFEAVFSWKISCDDDEPPTLKGGEYDKKSFMNDEELAEFSELSENEDIEYNVKYQEFYFERSSKYNAKEWIKKWLSERS